MQQDSFVRVGDRVHDAQGEGWGGEGGEACIHTTRRC